MGQSVFHPARSLGFRLISSQRYVPKVVFALGLVTIELGHPTHYEGDKAGRRGEGAAEDGLRRFGKRVGAGGMVTRGGN